MSDKITQDEKTYIEQNKVEEIISGRISKYASKIATYEEKISELEGRLDEQTSELGSASLLREKVETLTQQLNKSNSRYERHTTLAKHKIQDPEVYELLEWQYDKSMSQLPKKSRVKFTEWIGECVEDPTKAPLAIRPHLPSPLNAAEETPSPQPTPPETNRPRFNAPDTNREVVPMSATATPTMNEILRDKKLYAQYRDQILTKYRG